jgi:hypothetical protein
MGIPFQGGIPQEYILLPGFAGRHIQGGQSRPKGRHGQYDIPCFKGIQIYFFPDERRPKGFLLIFIALLSNNGLVLVRYFQLYIYIRK